MPHIINSRGIIAEKIPSVDLIKKLEICAPTTPSQLSILLKLLLLLSESKKSPKRDERYASSKREYEMMLSKRRNENAINNKPRIFFLCPVVKRDFPFPLPFCFILDFLFKVNKNLVAVLGIWQNFKNISREIRYYIISINFAAKFQVIFKSILKENFSMFGFF